MIALIAMPYALCGVDLPPRHADHPQPARRRRDLRVPAPGEDAHQWSGLGARHRATGRDRGAFDYVVICCRLVLAPTLIFLCACLFAIIAAVGDRPPRPERRPHRAFSGLRRDVLSRPRQRRRKAPELGFRIEIGLVGLEVHRHRNMLRV